MRARCASLNPGPSLPMNTPPHAWRDHHLWLTAAAWSAGGREKSQCFICTLTKKNTKRTKKNPRCTSSKRFVFFSSIVILFYVHEGRQVAAAVPATAERRRKLSRSQIVGLASQSCPLANANGSSRVSKTLLTDGATIGWANRAATEERSVLARSWRTT